MTLPRTARALVALTIGIALTSSCSSGDPKESTATSSAQSPTDEPSKKKAPVTGTPSPSDSHELIIADQGLTAFPAQQGSGGNPFVNIAFVIENPSADWATAVSLNVQLLDANGMPVVDVDSGNEVVHLSTPAIAPGSKQAFSTHLYTDRDATTSLSVAIDGASYYPGDDKRFKPFVLSAPQTTQDDNKLDISFTLTSPYDEEISADTYAIFRDASGKIIGGTHSSDAADLSYDPGENVTSISSGNYGMPPGVDPSSIEVFASPQAT